MKMENNFYNILGAVIAIVIAIIPGVLVWWILGPEGFWQRVVMLPVVFFLTVFWVRIITVLIR